MPDVGLDLDSSVGAVFIAALFSVMFYGLSCAQLAHYCYHYLRHDKASVNVLVFCTWLLSTVVSVSDIYILWFFVVKGHGDVFGLLSFPKLYELEYASTFVTICVVQFFYIHGIWQLLARLPTKARLAITSLPVTLSLLSLVFGFVGVKIVTKHKWIISETLPPDTLATSIIVCAAALADICICITLSWALRRNMTGFRRTDGVIRTLTVYIINRGMLTAITHIALLGTYMASVHHNEMIWTIFLCAGSKLYVNSMMAVLNARCHLSSGMSYTSGF